MPDSPMSKLSQVIEQSGLAPEAWLECYLDRTHSSHASGAKPLCSITCDNLDIGESGIVSNNDANTSYIIADIKAV
jgi:hypothetical protein